MLLFFFLPGCITDQVVTTTFAPDGSCIREVTFTSDSDSYDLSSLDIPVDSTWTIIEKKDSVDSSKVHVLARKEFHNVTDVNVLYDSLKNNFSGVKRKMIWRKQFRWFYTVYHYRETIYAIFHQRPMSEYLTPEEIRYALAGDEERDSLFGDLDSTALKKLDQQVDEQGWKWMSACTFDEFYAGLLKTAEAHPSGSLTVKKVQDAKENMLGTFNIENSDSAFKAYFFRTFGISDPDSLVNAYPEEFSSYTKLEDIVGRTFGEEYENRVKMPGVLVHTNAEKKNNGILSWKVSSMKFLGSDFVMEALYRKANKWAFYVAALVVISAVLFWVIPARNKSKE
jgi:hypothetical protein